MTDYEAEVMADKLYKDGWKILEIEDVMRECGLAEDDAWLVCKEFDEIRPAKPMTRYGAETMAANLYDGGWRAEDREDLIREYELTEDEADMICEALAELESR